MITWFGTDPAGISPVKLAWLILVAPFKTKSSAASISSFPGLPGRDAIPIWFVTFPVLNKNGSAAARGGFTSTSATTRARMEEHVNNGLAGDLISALTPIDPEVIEFILSSLC